MQAIHLLASSPPLRAFRPEIKGSDQIAQFTAPDLVHTPMGKYERLSYEQLTLKESERFYRGKKNGPIAYISGWTALVIAQLSFANILGPT